MSSRVLTLEESFSNVIAADEKRPPFPASPTIKRLLRQMGRDFSASMDLLHRTGRSRSPWI